MKLLPLILSLLAVTSLPAAEPTAPTISATGTGPGWRALGPDDFKPVNSAANTWKWEADGLHCTGEPISVLRTAKE
jgi:hypothetical protein